MNLNNYFGIHNLALQFKKKKTNTNHYYHHFTKYVAFIPPEKGNERRKGPERETRRGNEREKRTRAPLR